MDRPEAYQIISTALEGCRTLGFQALCARVGTTDTREILGASGVRYTLEVSVAWKDSDHRAVVIRGRIDDQNSFHSVPLEEKIYVSDVAQPTSKEGDISGLGH